MTTDTLDAPATTTDTGNQDATQSAAPSQTTGAGPDAGQTGTQATAGADNPPVAGSDKAGEQSPVVEYEPFQFPEGLTADEELLGEFKATAKELGLSQKDAQRIADLQGKAFAKQQEAMSRAKAQWAEQSKADQEFGGEALAENLGVAKKAMDAFASTDLRKLLNDTGLGNHPEVIRHFVRVGKAISEDGRVVSGSRAAVPSDPAKRLFPNQA